MTRAGVFETIIGALVLIVAAIFLFYGYTASGKSVGGDGYRVDAVFGRVDGVTVGSEVRLAGVKIGSVSSNEIDTSTYEALLSLRIDRDVPIPEDSVAKIVSDGLIGGAHVAIEPGASDVFLRNGEKITITRGSVDLLNLAVQAFTNQGGGAEENSDADAGLDPLGDF